MWLIALAVLHGPAVVTVGDGKQFARIEDAVKAASAGDEIDVYPSAAGYSRTAVLIRTSGLKIVGMGEKVKLDGGDFEYSGEGSVPRAIFQIDPSADGVTIENFELTGAHNRSYNGAGVRINAAKNASVRNCNIHDCDMGVMSGGVPGDAHAGENQTIERCHIHHNGNAADPGYNHNLYLGGTSVSLRFCEIDHSLTGHNLKSRAHFTRVEYCYIHDSSNREADFVDAWDTQPPHSNAVLLGCVVAKDPNCKGNRTVINFGQEGGRRDGTLFLIHCSIHTPFHSSVVNLSSPSAKLRMTNCTVQNFGDAHPALVSYEKGAELHSVSGSSSAFSVGYDASGTLFDAKTWYIDTRAESDAAPLSFQPVSAYYEDGDGRRTRAVPQFRLVGSDWKPAASPTIGAR